MSLNKYINIARTVVAVDQLNPAIVTHVDCRGYCISCEIPAVRQDHRVAGAPEGEIPYELIPYMIKRFALRGWLNRSNARQYGAIVSTPLPRTVSGS